MEKIIIYQIFTRLFLNQNKARKPFGTLAENGSGKLSSFDADVLKRIKDMGFSHVWYTGLLRHATKTDYTLYGIPLNNPDVIKGEAGSPYAIVDYYDIDPDLCSTMDVTLSAADNAKRRMQEFEALVERTHKAGLKMIMDFVPNHVAREYNSICKPVGVRGLGQDDNRDWHFSTSNNFYYCWGQPLDLHGITDKPTTYTESPARATGNDHFDNYPGCNDWYETVKLNYGIDYCDAGGRSEHFDPIPDTWLKMTEILLFWASKGIDAVRCDMAEMVPSAFWAYATAAVRAKYPDFRFIGEVYDPSQYRNYIASGFDYLYDKVGMYDSLRDIVYGRRWASDITSQWRQNDDIREHMLYFLENHDEQRIASQEFASDPQRAVPALVVSALLQSSPLMVYFGQEYGEKGSEAEGFSGQDGRTTIFDYWSLDCINNGFGNRRKLTKEQKAIYSQYKTILGIASKSKAVSEGVMYDLMYCNPQLHERQYAFIRKVSTETLLVVANFSSAEVNTTVNIPSHAFEWLSLEEKSVKAKDLITGNSLDLALKKDAPLCLTIPSYGALVLKF